MARVDRSDSEESTITTKDKTTLVFPHQRYKSIQTRIRYPSWVLSNRSNFTPYIERQFNPSLSDTKLVKAETSDSKESDVPSYHSQQRFVAEYMQDDSPYRGLLFYHGLGSGKSCSSISVAEGLKNHYPIYVITPKSLQLNYKN